MLNKLYEIQDAIDNAWHKVVLSVASYDAKVMVQEMYNDPDSEYYHCESFTDLSNRFTNDEVIQEAVVIDIGRAVKENKITNNDIEKIAKYISDSYGGLAIFKSDKNIAKMLINTYNLQQSLHINQNQTIPIEHPNPDPKRIQNNIQINEYKMFCCNTLITKIDQNISKGGSKFVYSIIDDSKGRTSSNSKAIEVCFSINIPYNLCEKIDQIKALSMLIDIDKKLSNNGDVTEEMENNFNFIKNALSIPKVQFSKDIVKNILTTYTISSQYLKNALVGFHIPKFTIYNNNSTTGNKIVQRNKQLYDKLNALALSKNMTSLMTSGRNKNENSINDIHHFFLIK